MQNRMKRFLDSIGIEDFESFDMDFVFIAKDPSNPEQINMAICKKTPWDYGQFSRFFLGLQHVHYRYTIRFSYDQQPTIKDCKDLLEPWGTDQYFGSRPFNVVDGDGLTIDFPSLEFNEGEGFKKDIESFLRFLNYDFKPSYTYSYAVQKKESEEARMKAEQQMLTASREEYLSAKRWQKGNYKKVDRIDELFAMGPCNVEVVGEAYGNIDVRTSKKGRLWASFGIGDDYGAINVRAFEGQGIKDEDINALNAKCNKGKSTFMVRVFGALQEDSRDNLPSITAHKIEFDVSKPMREDPYPRKRVELHLHTNMSMMDALPPMEDYCALAKHMGMEAIGLTDHGVVQAFPAAQRAAKQYGLKIVYGCELYMFDKHQIYVLNPAKTPLKGAKYCVFDTETTGLSTRYDRIIEFAGVIVQDGQIIDRFSQYVNPGMKIPEAASRVNHITDEMVADKPRLEDVMPRILEFMGDSILVAHNATFDVGFINAALKRMGLPDIANPVVDTLPISHYLFPESSRHTEGAMLRNLGLSTYDESDAHEALYDAEQLSHGWLEIVNHFEKEKPGITHEDLKDLMVEIPDENDPDKDHYQAVWKKYNAFCSHLREYHCDVWVKNEQGLSDLYRIVTEGHTTYFSKIPKTPRDLIEKYRSNFIVGSACFNSEIFEIARNRTREELVKAMEFYDYIEIQPIENYSFLIDMGRVDGRERLIEILKDIIEAASIAGKKIIATGDCHYLNPDDKILRDIYISTLVPSIGRHPLNPGARANLSFENPDQHFRSTQEMVDSFSAWLDDKDFIEQIVIDNPKEIADSVDVLEPVKDDLFKPDANLPHSDTTLRELCESNFDARYRGNPDPEVQKRIEEVHQRLEKELNGIIDHGYAVTYIIAHHLVKMAHDEPEHYIVGSRGSVGSSFVATMADITEVNPLPPHYLCPHCHYFEWGDKDKYLSGFDLPDKECPMCHHKMVGNGQNIPFETFLGFAADKVPDIDLNFEDESQHKAHNYTKILLGEHNVYRCGTIETVAEKTAYGFAMKFFESKGKNTSDPLFKNYVAYIASRCQGVKKTTGQHPGGIIVVPADHSLFDFTAVQHPANDLSSDWLTTHYDFHSMHDELLKLDILGHVDPMAMRYYRDYTGIPIESIPMNDPKVLSLFTSARELHMNGNFLGVKTGASALPEFGTDLAQRMLLTAQPKCFNDLLIISGLAHGTNVWSGNAEDLITSGTTDLHGVIGCRDDIMTYLISKGIEPQMAFKIMESVRKGRGLSEEYESAMVAHKVPEFYIESCKKIKYLFPRGHATAYVMMAVRVAYFKLYHPLEFYAVFFSVRCDNYDIKSMVAGYEAVKAKITELQNRQYDRSNPLSDPEQETLATLKIAIEMLQRGYTFSNIDLYRSDAKMFLVDKDKKQLIPPFSCVPRLGLAAAKTIVEARKEGKFLSKEDLLSRTKLSSTNVADLSDLGVLDGMSERNQMSIFDFI